MKGWLIKRGLAAELSLHLIYILPYYFYLVHLMYHFLSNQNQSVYLFLFSVPTKFKIKRFPAGCTKKTFGKH